MEPPRSPGATDRALRDRVFWSLVAIVAGFLAAGHLVHRAMSYNLSRSQAIRHGSNGLTLGRVEERGDDRPTVVLVGNSVYQFYGTSWLMKNLAKQEGRPIRFINLAQTAAGAGDYVIQVAKGLAYRPDVLVVCITHVTFSREDPFFRTDVRDMAFDPDVLGTVPLSFLRRHYDAASASECVASWLVPLKRIDPVIRHDLAARMGAVLPPWFLQPLRFPTLNLPAAWAAADERAEDEVRARAVQIWNAPPYDDYEQCLEEMIGMARSKGVPILFLWQEAAPAPSGPEVLSALRRLCEAHDGAHLVELQHHWDPLRFPDRLHPGLEETEPYARRHYEAILRVLGRKAAAAAGTGEDR